MRSVDVATILIMWILSCRALKGPRKLWGRKRGVALGVNLKAKVVDCDEGGVAKSADVLVRGGLVAFPTETVYGLGANALNASSVASIFAAKQRPSSDPLIVHISSKSDMYPLFVFASPEARRVCEVLCDSFWPGPLTIIHKASPSIPQLVTAGTGFVGLRSPQHPVARALLQRCGLPIAAPSANRFGHVSPTSAQHVLADLGHVEDLVVLRDDAANTGGCRVGIESTVCRVSADGALVSVLRCGAVTGASIAKALDSAGLSLSTLVAIDNAHLLQPLVSASPSPSPADTTAATGSSVGRLEPEAGAVAPGQMLKHYSPDLPTYIYAPPSSALSAPLPLTACLVIDFGGALSALQPDAAWYHDLSPSGSAAEACQHIFSWLRLAEGVDAAGKGVRAVLLPDLRARAASDEGVRALWERLHRAASGTVASARSG